MKIDLTGVLSEQHLAIERVIIPDMKVFVTSQGSFPVEFKKGVHIRITHIQDNQLSIVGDTEVRTTIPCSRCLKDVNISLSVSFHKKIDLDEDANSQKDDFDETNYMNGYMLDADGLIYNELLIEWPTKVLCKADCKGLCSVCGTDLNTGVCNCDHEERLDPRMSAIRDIFMNSKEV